MSGDLRAQQLIEEILDTGKTAEEVCRESPDLLPEVRESWRRHLEIQAQVDALFPEPGSVEGRDRIPGEVGPPKLPGYEILGMLGHGGIGVVYKALHLRLNRIVAVKMLIAGAWATPAQRHRFAKEAELVARLRHPNIVQVYDVGDLDGRPYFTMEFVDGGSLDRMLAGTPRPVLQAAALLATLAEAVDAAHREAVIHRDLKPSNILLSADGTPKISDFGLARHLDVGAALTQTGVAIGTPSYMAPEQARGKAIEIGPAADLYSLGSVLYELLTGRPPFRAQTAAETTHQVLTLDPVPPSRLNPKVPRDVETICLKCLQKEPRLRYAGAAALAADLRSFLRGDSIAARPEGRLRRLARRVRRRPALSAATAGVILLSATLIGGGLWWGFERAATARRVDAEWSALERASEEDLREAGRWLQKAARPEASAALERARGRLGDRGSVDLRRRLDQGTSDLQMLMQLDAIRLDRADLIDGVLAVPRAEQALDAAFRSAGLGGTDEAASAVAARIKASNVKGPLVAALDDLASASLMPRRQEWLLTVARLADEDLTGWRGRARDPATWKDRKALVEIISVAPVDGPFVPLLLALAKRLDDVGGDSIPFLERLQRANPGDFWVNFRIAKAFGDRNKFDEAIRCYQAAMAVRPDTAIVHHNIGVMYKALGRHQEALVQLREAVRIVPNANTTHAELAQVLQFEGRHEESIAETRSALCYGPGNANTLWILGTSLENAGRLPEALDEYRRAVALDPRHLASQYHLRTLLIRQGRSEQALAAWEAALAVDPPEHISWYGYAEFCCFLGRDDDYRRARRALLAKFGESTDPTVAERTGRACLLLPASEVEMRQISRLAERCNAVDRGVNSSVYPNFAFVSGLADYRAGRLDWAISSMRVDAYSALGPGSRLVLSLALAKKGRTAEARRTLAEAILAYDWRAARVVDQDGWILHTLRREAEGLILPGLPCFLAGTHQPRDNDERLAMLGVCQFEDRPLAAARLYADAFASAPELADDLRAGHRTEAALMAARAGCGRGTDAACLGDPERLRWRAQARQWLRMDLAAWIEMLDTDPPAVREPLRRTLAGWKADPALSDLREPVTLDGLSPDEREDWLSLWDEADKVLDRSGLSR